MTTFVNHNFSSSTYSKFRPTYPLSLFNYIKKYRSVNSPLNQTKLAVDLACGTGQATQDLTLLSEKVVGIDHSDVMIKEARKFLPTSNFEFKVGTDLDLSKLLKKNSVDLLTVAEGAHWLNYPQFWDEAFNVLAPGGTLAIFSYSTFTFPDYPEVSSIINDYAYGEDKCGPFWEEGRKLLNNEYINLRETIPESKFKNIEYRVNHFDKFRQDEPFELVKHDIMVGDVIMMLKTWSSYFNYRNWYPNSPDIADGVMDLIKLKTGLSEGDKVTVKWNTVLLFATKEI